MVQERDFKPRKINESDRPLPPRYDSNGSSVGTDVASGLALLLSVIAFFLSAFAVFQATAARRTLESLPPSSSQGGGGSFAAPISRPILPQIAPYRFQRVEPGQFVQPAYNGAGQVELLSATRSNLGSDEVKIRLRIRRFNQPIQGSGEINLAQTSILNTRTNESFRVTEFSDYTVYLANLRPGAATEATITARVPQGRDRIDLEIPGAPVFRNVPLSAET